MLIGMLAFLLLLLVLLAIPLTLTYQVSWRQVFQGDVHLCWAFGLLRLRLPVSQDMKPASTDRRSSKEHAGKKPVREKPRSRKKLNPMAAIRMKSFRRRILRFLHDLWHIIKKRDVQLRLRIGLGDPADTGQLWAVVGPLSGMLFKFREVAINIEPEFMDATFEMDSSGSIRVIPLQMIFLTIGLLLSPALWQGMRQMRAAG